MGGAKKAMMEAKENGYSLPEYGEKFLCTNHYDDIYINRYIKEHSVKGKCSYCGKKANVIDLHDFVAYITEHIKKYYGSPDDECLPTVNSYYDDEYEEISGLKRVGCYITPSKTEVFESTADLLYEVDLYSENLELNTDIENSFFWDTWIQHDPMVLSLGEELSWKWTQFEAQVKHKQRFTFFKTENYLKKKIFDYGESLSQILFEISKIISDIRLIEILKAGIEIYRCRFENDISKITSFNSITSAPNDVAKQSRMSPAGISVFYGAFDSNTAIQESKPSIIKDEKQIIGTFKTTCDLNILDLTQLPPQSFWSTYDWQALGFLHSFCKQICKQIDRDDRIHIEYVPTQIFSEYLRYVYPLAYGEKIDGVIFKSSLSGSTANNIVLFYDQKSSKDILDLVQIQS